MIIKKKKYWRGHGEKWTLLYSWGCWYNRYENQYGAVVVKSLSHVRLFANLWTIIRQASLSFTTFQSLLKPMSIELVMPLNHFILCGSLSLLPSIFPNIGVFFNEPALPIRWPKCWRISFSISLSNEYSWLIPFKTDGLTSLQFKGLSRVFFNTTVQKHHLFGSHIHTLFLEKP